MALPLSNDPPPPFDPEAGRPKKRPILCSRCSDTGLIERATVRRARWAWEAAFTMTACSCGMGRDITPALECARQEYQAMWDDQRW